MSGRWKCCDARGRDRLRPAVHGDGQPRAGVPARFESPRWSSWWGWETADEVEALLDRLAETGVDVVTIGQYLRPSSRHLPVVVPCRRRCSRAMLPMERLGLVVVSGPSCNSFEAEAAYRQALRRKGWGACS